MHINCWTVQKIHSSMGFFFFSWRRRKQGKLFQIRHGCKKSMSELQNRTINWEARPSSFVCASNKVHMVGTRACLTKICHKQKIKIWREKTFAIYASYVYTYFTYITKWHGHTWFRFFHATVKTCLMGPANKGIRLRWNNGIVQPDLKRK